VTQLKHCLTLFSIVLVFVALTGIQSIRIPESGLEITSLSDLSGLIVTKLDALGRIKALLLSAFLALVTYGIHGRFLIVWKFGWIVLLAGSFACAVSALLSSLQLPPPQNWIASTAVLVGTCLATLYWAFWWKRQKVYFTSSQSDG
jgi:hypothetical protein